MPKRILGNRASVALGAFGLIALGVYGPGCEAPQQVVPAAPPGLELKFQPRDEGDNGPQALGEQAAVSGKAPTPAVVADVPPALATAKGEYKTTPAGVKYTTVKEGTGAVVRAGQKVTVHYTGTLEDGRKFDSSRDRDKPATFSIGTGDVITGWDEAVPGMKIGEQRKLIVPPNAGYGAQGRPPQIPPNATLNFDIELIDVQ
jgi:FKBP-type peptidyl-prolyl cis-trans isomerase